MIGFAILGATAYTARELLRILARHPAVTPVLLASRSGERQGIEKIHPSLRGLVTLPCEPLGNSPETQLPKETKIVFLTLPRGVALTITPALVNLGFRVIDVSGDYRLKDASLYNTWYKFTHTDPKGLAEAVYGLPELVPAKRIAGARILANPGCYATAAALAAAPFLKLADRKHIILDAKSGVSGAGRTLSDATHFPECNEGISPYNVGVHQHTPEIEQALAASCGEPVHVLMTPHLVPMDRGILATMYLRLPRKTTQENLYRQLREFYRKAPFVRVREDLPSTKDVSGTNFCDIAIRLCGDTLVVMAVIDNLVKGAAGQAVQNMNLMIGRPETEGLK
ncbi:MAG: N-acetyl-gamma-glutamyl-phosphate reductase [Planctomycetota bacterium]